MNLPQVVTPADLQQLAAPDETFAARVVIRQLSNTGVYTLRGVSRKYLAIRDNEVGAHVIDVPLSVWMHGVPRLYQKNTSVAHDIQSTRHALKVPIVVLIVPWKHAKAPVASVSADSRSSGSWRAEQLDLIERLVVRIAAEQNEGRFARICGELEDQRVKEPIADDVEAIMQAHGRTGILDFIKRFWTEAKAEDLVAIAAIPETPPEPNPGAKSAPPATENPAATKPVKSNAQRQKEYRDRKAAEKAAAEAAATTPPAKKAAKKAAKKKPEPATA